MRRGGCAGAVPPGRDRAAGAEEESPAERVRAEVARLQRAGASQVREAQEWGELHVVMQDPGGNELCVQ
ncbi:MAG TPA: VOC family protein [Micromonosporaceae bacterium]|nr:VOC family protein [Micromonosporaceae bacterium]